jgi:hypothetical protein
MGSGNSLGITGELNKGVEVLNRRFESLDARSLDLEETNAARNKRFDSSTQN